jgi:RHS repeat-associated protein
MGQKAPTTTIGVLTANAVDPSGLYTTSASSTFTVTAGNPNQPSGTVTSGYDGDGNVTSRSWSNGTVQTLTWDAFDRLIKVSQRDSSQNGYDWTAIYDGLGRRISTTNQPVVNNVANGASTVTASIYDPQVEFLEIGVSVNGVKAWKVYGPDLNGTFGGLQGTGGLEATIMNGTGAATGVLNDYFGNDVATISGGSVTWNTTKVGGYGPLPDSTATPLTDATQLAQATVWRGHRIDPTGFYYQGFRYYEPTSGRWLSCDPLGFAASTSLYEFVGNDPINLTDPLGLAPGDKYKSENEAAKQAIRDINPTSIKEHSEYAGFVYQNSDGTFSYTSPNKGTKDSSRPSYWDAVDLTWSPFKSEIGLYHTHGGKDAGYDNENFSPEDMDVYDSTNEPGWVGTPNGDIKKYTPRPGEPENGIVQTIGHCPK